MFSRLNQHPSACRRHLRTRELPAAPAAQPVAVRGLHSPGEEFALDPEQQAGGLARCSLRVRLRAVGSRRRGGLHESPVVSGARNP